MEVILAKVTQQAMSYAIRSGIAITSTYALKQCGRLMKAVDGQAKEELATLQLRLDSKIKIISPAIDMIELIAARGNTTLESAVVLTKSLRWDIQTLGSRVEAAVTETQLLRSGNSKAKSRDQNDLELKIIISEMKKLLERIEDAVPLINLAITTSGVSLSTTLPATVSPSRLLQASTFLTSGDTQYCIMKPRAQQIGPTFYLSMYMLFSGHANRPLEEGLRETTWKEVMHKARATLLRVPLDHVHDFPATFDSASDRTHENGHHRIPSENILNEFAYQLLVVEDLDDGRVHTFEDNEPQPEPYEGVAQAGVREIIPIHEISKIFYADTGKILNIGTEGETNNPILLLKRDIHAPPPRRMMDRQPTENGYESDDSCTVDNDEPDEQSEVEAQLRRESTPNILSSIENNELPTFPWRLPVTLDLEWMAFEVYTEDPSSDSELDEPSDSEPDISSPTPAATTAAADPDRTRRSESTSLLVSLSNLRLDPPSSSSTTHTNQLVPSPQKNPARTTTTPTGHPHSLPTALPPIKTSLSLLESLIRLTSLQQFQQTSHLSISDEFLSFFLSDSSTVGAGSDAELRRRVRGEARRRVGFDPYDESPIKRRGEKYVAGELGEEGEDGEGAEYDERDYDMYPVGRSSPYARSRSSTPLRSSPFRHATPPPPSGSRSKILPSSANQAHYYASAPQPSSVSASPLLRRATTQPGRPLKQPSFRGPSTASPSDSSNRTVRQRVNHEGMAGMGVGVVDTPPDSGGKA